MLNTFSIDYSIKAVAKTDRGNLRPNNEDNFAVCTVPCKADKKCHYQLYDHLPPHGAILVIADGMGGAKAGELASEIAIESIIHQFQELILLPENESEIASLLKNIILHAHEEIVAYSDVHKQFKGMGTTVVLAWILEGMLYLTWCGDSRCYLLQKNNIQLLTEDHSKVWELVKKGEINPEQARTHPQAHIITQALGDKKLIPQPSFKAMPITHQNRILLCSDGLNSMLLDTDIAQTINNQEDNLDNIANLLIEKAKDAGGQDNITVILADFIAKK